MSSSLGSRIKEIRNVLNLTLELVADNAKISKAKLSRIENDELEPNDEIVSALANAMGINEGHIYNQKFEVLDLLRVNLKANGLFEIYPQSEITTNEFEFRYKETTTGFSVNDALKTAFTEFKAQMDLERLLGKKVRFTNPTGNRPVVNNINEIEKYSVILRKKLGLSDRLIISVTEVIENLNILLCFKEFKDDFVGMMFTLGNRPAIIVNSKGWNDCRVRFSMFHELAHVLFSFDCSESLKEKLCNAFAGYMLLPRVVIEKEIGHRRKDVDITDFVKLHKRFGISIEAAMLTAVNSNIISWDQYSLLKLSRKKVKADFYSDEEARTLFELFRECLRLHKISKDKAMDYARLFNNNSLEFEVLMEELKEY